MRLTIAGMVLVLAMELAAAGARGQAQGPPQGSPMNGAPPSPDAIRLQQQVAAAHPAPGPLKISFGKQSAELTPESFAALPHQALTVYNEHARATQTYSGVLVSALLTRLGVPEKPRGKDFRLYLVAEGADGYQVVYSLGEVTPDVHDGAVIVADSLDGKPLAENGPFQLVAAGEKRPARWVRNLVAIRVLTAE
jgi:hypothetical protein